MKLKLSRAKFLTSGFILMVILAFIWGFTWDMMFPGDVFTPANDYNNADHDFGMFHTMFNLFTIIGWVVALIMFVAEWVDKNSTALKFLYSDEYCNTTEAKDDKPFKFKKYLGFSIGILLGIVLINVSTTLFKGSTKMYNTSKVCQNLYQKKVQEKAGFYEMLWQTYLQKEKITNINKEAFMQATQLIMENRRDGQSVTWKWLQENQPIDYNTFSQFYADLSAFIADKREGYFNIEKECQLLAAQNNMLLDTFPNNFYNKILNCERIQFEYGYLSDSTKQMFKIK
jgi:hypothetical protein